MFELPTQFRRSHALVLFSLYSSAQVNLDPRFVQHTELNILDFTDNGTTPVLAIDAERLGNDWLSLSEVDNPACEALPTPYDNDYRGADEVNPDDTASRFEPDKPIFARLPDRSFALYDMRMIMHENTLEDPLMDGGGASVLRSTMRSQRDGIITKKYPWNEEYYICTCVRSSSLLLALSHGSFLLPSQNCQTTTRMLPSVPTSSPTLLTWNTARSALSRTCA